MYIYACYVDFKKAYDRVQHQLLWKKLKTFNLGEKVINLVKSLYSNVQCSVRMEDGMTDFFDYLVGVRQGCILSPLLFNLFINDLQEMIQEHGLQEGIKMSDLVVYMLLYADDIVLIADTPEGLQEFINVLFDFCKKSRMDVNVKKTKIMVFEKRCSLQSQNLKFYFGDSELEKVDQYKYLGTIFSRTMNFQENLDNIIGKANKAAFLFWQYIDKFQFIKVSQVLRLYESLVVPILLYNCECWGPLVSESMLERTVEVFHRKQLKRILLVGEKCPNAAVYLELGKVPLIKEVKLKFLKFLLQIRAYPEKHLCWKAFVHLMKSENKFRSFVESIFADLERNLAVFMSDFHEEWYGVEKHQLILIHANRIWTSKLVEKLENNAKENVKMRFYQKVTEDQPFGFKMYLDKILNRKSRSYLTRFRCGSHKLNVEIGRWMHIEHLSRKCRFCSSGLVEDEEHMLECSFFEEERIQLNEQISTIIPNFNQADKNTQLKLLFVDSLEIHNLTKNYIGRVMDKVNKKFDNK